MELNKETFTVENLKKLRYAKLVEVFKQMMTQNSTNKGFKMKVICLRRVNNVDYLNLRKKCFDGIRL